MATQSSAWTGEKPRKAGNGAGRGSAARSGEKVVPISPTGSAQDIHRTPPHSVDAEQGVLGSMLISPRETIAECVEKINEEYFYVPAHRTIYNVLVDRPMRRDVKIFFIDRKSTRLNSSHRCISYAVFCLKKKKKSAR